MGAAQQPLPGERIATFEQSLQENLQRLQQYGEDRNIDGDAEQRGSDEDAVRRAGESSG